MKFDSYMNFMNNIFIILIYSKSQNLNMIQNYFISDINGLNHKYRIFKTRSSTILIINKYICIIWYLKLLTMTPLFVYICSTLVFHGCMCPTSQVHWSGAWLTLSIFIFRFGKTFTIRKGNYLLHISRQESNWQLQ